MKLLRVQNILAQSADIYIKKNKKEKKKSYFSNNMQAVHGKYYLNKL